MPLGARTDPYLAYNFLCEVDGLTRAGFRECQGLDARQDPVDYREGNGPLHLNRQPGLVRYSNITLRWGMTDDPEFWEWRLAAMEGRIERKNFSIVLLNDRGEERIRWNCQQGWPSVWTGPSFNATGAEVAIESVEIVHEGLTRA